MYSVPDVFRTCSGHAICPSSHGGFRNLYGSVPPSCPVQNPGSLSEVDQATGAVSPTLLALHPRHQMARPRVERRSPQESQPARHKVHLASDAAALG